MPSTYYTDLFSKIDIGQVADLLLSQRITSRTQSEIQISCPRHESISGRSFHIDLARQRWYCFGCTMGGDALHMVEFIQSGTVTKSLPAGTTMPESHRAARDWLALQAGIQPLSARGQADATVKQTETEYAESQRIRAVLGKLVDHYHQSLLARPKAIALLHDKWGINQETIDTLKIGFAEATGQIKYLRDLGIGEADILGTGAFALDQQDRTYPFFKNRIMFPYWERGEVVYLIGRRSPWTEDNKYEQAKYKKLPQHNETRPWVSPTITDHIFNADCIAAQRRGDGYVVITEGVTDAIALIQIGVPVISPVTVKFRNQDVPLLSKLLAGVPAIYIIQDNEISGAGWRGAMDTAAALGAAGIPTRIVEIPLLDTHIEAREKFKTVCGAVGSEAARSDLGRELAEAGKRDLCDFLRDAEKITDINTTPGGAAARFTDLLPLAKPPVAWAIDAVSPTGTRDEILQQIKPILNLMAAMPPVAQGEYAEAIKERLGICKTNIMAEIKIIARNARRYRRDRGKPKSEQSTSTLDAHGVAGGKPTRRSMTAHFLETNPPLIFAENHFWEYENGYYVDVHDRVDGSIFEFLDDYYFDGDTTTNQVNEIHRRAQYKTILPKGRKLNDQKYLLNVENGMFNMETGKLQLHEASCYSTIRLPYAHDPDAPCPRWIQFLEEIFPGDDKSQQLLCQWFGYCLIADTRFQKALFCIGDGKNGKSTALEVLYQLVGTENCSHISLSDLSEKYGPIQIKNKLVNMCGEVEAGEISDSSIFKQIVGGETIQAEDKFEKAVRFRAFARLCFATNNMPRFRDTSFGLTRRILILSFDQTFKGTRDDKELKLKLRAELPGIFQWALTGYSDLMATNEFIEPPKMAVIMDSFKTSGSLVAQFLEERCRYAPHLVEWKSSLRKAFVEYCHDSGYARVPATANMWTDIRRFAPIRFAQRQTRRGNKMDLAVHGIEILTGGMDGVEYEDNPGLGDADADECEEIFD